MTMICIQMECDLGEDAPEPDVVDPGTEFLPRPVPLWRTKKYVLYTSKRVFCVAVFLVFVAAVHIWSPVVKCLGLEDRLRWGWPFEK